jgi:hypothetical protein
MIYLFNEYGFLVAKCKSCYTTDKARKKNNLPDDIPAYSEKGIIKAVYFFHFMFRTDTLETRKHYKINNADEILKINNIKG